MARARDAGQREFAQGSPPAERRREVSERNLTAQREYDELVWMPYAGVAGLLGAVLVAVFFLVVDLASGRAAGWTPAFLGSILFRGEAIASNAHPLGMLPIVLGYTAIHGVTFFAFAIFVGAAHLAPRPPVPMTRRGAVSTALIFFLGCESLFFVLGWLAGPGLALAERLGFGWVSGANALAAVGMTWVIDRSARQLAARSAYTARRGTD
ncbi:MAG: hypothetical protein R3F35_23655 [Myxococcota bacterium]